MGVFNTVDYVELVCKYDGVFEIMIIYEYESFENYYESTVNIKQAFGSLYMISNSFHMTASPSSWLFETPLYIFSLYSSGGDFIRKLVDLLKYIYSPLNNIQSSLD